MKKIIYSLKTMFIAALMLFINVQVMAQTPSITLLQPTDAGIEITAGAKYLISWTDNFNSKVDIYLSKDGGVSYSNGNKIAENVSGSTYQWNTSGTALGIKYRIKVQSSNSSIYNYVSEHNFSIVDQVNGYITLEQPTGGEEWTEGTKHLISWSDNLNAPVKVELWKSNALWKTIASSTEANHINWTIPDISVNYTGEKIFQIKISSTVSGATTPPATSGKFTIETTAGTFIEVLQPNGGEKWTRGTKHMISWNDDITSGKVDIKLLNSDGSIADKKIEDDVSGSTYKWTILSNQAVSKKYKIQISDAATGSVIPSDKSEANFEITSSTGTFIKVIQPNGGEKWTRGTKHMISWNDDITSGKVDIDLWKDGQYYKHITTEESGSTYKWTIDANRVLSKRYKIEILDHATGSVIPSDQSDKYFEITASTGTSIEVLQPNGSEKWKRGTKHMISWKDDITSGKVDIDLWKDGSYYRHITTEESGSTYKWTIDANRVLSNRYKIEVLDHATGSVIPSDQSDHYFEITASSGTEVTLLQPNGGEVWTRGTKHLISWTDDFPEKVFLKLYNNNVPVSASKSGLPAAAVSGCTYKWTLGSNLDKSKKYKIKIYSELDEDINDESAANFEINASTGTYVTVLQPEGGEVWMKTTKHLISWNNDFPENVKLELYDNGVFVNSNKSGLPVDAVSGSTYSWTIPTTVDAGVKYRIKIISILDDDISGESAGNFSIIEYAKGADKNGGIINIMNAADVSVYPNPANQNISLSIANADAENYSVEMYNSIGSLVMKTNIIPGSSNNKTISTNDLPNGIYFLNVRSDNTRISKKIIIRH